MRNNVKTIGRIYDFLENTNAKTVILYGGAGAGKSWTLAQFLIIEKFIKGKNKHILITRKTNPSLRVSTYQLVLDILNNLGVPYEHKKAEQILMFGKNRIIFRGLDDPEKIKSAEFNYIWMEEATEFTLDDYRQLRLRLRRHTGRGRNQIFLTFNPISVHHWIYEIFFEKKLEDDVDILRVNYKDNPFLDSEYVKLLEDLEQQDEVFYKIYTLGEFAQPRDLIYTNFEVVSDIPSSFDEIIWGLDFGYNNPTALLKIGIRDNEFWIIDEIYQTRLTNADLIELMKEKVKRTDPIYADSSEPARIEEIKRAGFNIYPADNNVKAGIDFVKRQKIYISQNCSNTLKEIRQYLWKKNKDGELLDEPVKFMDHSMDSMRYAIYTHCGKRQKAKVGIGKFKGVRTAW